MSLTTPLQGPLKNMRTVGIIEGISYIILLFIAMPLKYYGGMKEAVQYVGMAHGVLFLLFVLTIFFAIYKAGLSYGKGIMAFVASLIPFGTFFLDKPIFNKR